MVVIYIVYPHVGVFNPRDVAKRLKTLASVLQELSTLLSALPPDEAAPSLTLLQRTVASLYPATTEVAPVAHYPENLHPIFPVLWFLDIPTDYSFLARRLNFLHIFANWLIKQAEVRASRKQLPPVNGPQVDYNEAFGYHPCLRFLPVSVPSQLYAHLAECGHTHIPLALYLAVAIGGHRSIPCTVCSTVSKAAVFVPNQQLTAQEKKELFGSVLCFSCYLDRASFVEGIPYGFDGGDGNAQVEDTPEETEVEHQQTVVVQEPPPDAARLDGNCGLCRDPLGTDGSIAILSSCGHVFGETCLRHRLATVTRLSNCCPTCGESWDQALIFASTDVPEAKLAITDRLYRQYMASRVCCFGHSHSIFFHV